MVERHGYSHCRSSGPSTGTRHRCRIAPGPDQGHLPASIDHHPRGAPTASIRQSPGRRRQGSNRFRSPCVGRDRRCRRRRTGNLCRPVCSADADPCVTSVPMSPNELLRRIDERTAVVAIVGLGYVGLPLVAVYLNAGFRCIGYDVDDVKIDKLQRGLSYIAHLDHEPIHAAIATGRFRPTSAANELTDADAILICVPTPLTQSREPDLSYVEATALAIAATLRPGQLVVLESTTYPARPATSCCRSWRRRGCAPGSDFFLAYSPEREDPGNPEFATGKIPKVVGGLDAASLELAVALYRTAVDQVVPVSTMRGRRGVQDPGEHLPRGQHRARQRTQDAFRSHGHRRLGSDRRGRDETVRFPGVLRPDQAWAGTAFQSIRSTSTWLARRHGLTTQIRRARRRDQSRHARVRRRQSRASAERTIAIGTRIPSRNYRRRLQTRRRRPTGKPRLRGHGAAA